MILIFGTMGDIARTVKAALAIEHIDAMHVDFPQNLFRDEPGYRRELGKAIEAYRPEAVIPVGHPLALSRMRDELASRGIRAVVEREDLVRTLDSKVAFSALAARLGIPQPRIYAGIEDVDEASRVLFKRDLSFGGHGVHQPRSKEALANLIAHQSPGEPYLIEEYVDGDDYSVDALRCGDSFRFGHTAAWRPRARARLWPGRLLRLLNWASTPGSFSTALTTMASAALTSELTGKGRPIYWKRTHALQQGSPLS